MNEGRQDAKAKTTPRRGSRGARPQGGPPTWATRRRLRAVRPGAAPIPVSRTSAQRARLRSRAARRRHRRRCPLGGCAKTGAQNGLAKRRGAQAAALTLVASGRHGHHRHSRRRLLRRRSRQPRMRRARAVRGGVLMHQRAGTENAGCNSDRLRPLAPIARNAALQDHVRLVRHPCRLRGLDHRNRSHHRRQRSHHTRLGRRLRLSRQGSAPPRHCRKRSQNRWHSPSCSCRCSW